MGNVTDIPALEPRDPEGAIAAAAKRCSNWGRWGADDVLGTLNFLDDAKRVEGAALVRRGASFSLAQSFDTNGPQKGWRRRTNPVHTMTDTGTDAERGNQGFPHGIGGADDVIAMPLQASTQWDGLGHIFYHGNAWNGRRAGDVVTSEGDLVTGIERVFEAQPAFDPASSTREFHLLVSDYIVAVLGDTIAGLLADEAPNARLRLSANTPAAVDRAAQLLLSTDLLVLPHGFVSDLSHRDLYRDEWVCIVSADHPAVQDGLTVEDLETLPWVVTFHGPTAATPASRQMRMRGIEPRVQVVTENFLTVPGLVAGSDRVALLQRKLVDLLPIDVGVRALPCPVEVGQLVEAMWWHPVYDDDPEHAYLRDLVLRAVALNVGPDVELVST